MENLKQLPFVGTWFIVRQERRVAGRWKHEYDFEPNEWPVTFHKNQFFGEIIRNHGGPDTVMRGRWGFAPESGVISIRMDKSPAYADTCVLGSDDEGAYLYFFDDEPNVPPDPRAIIDHHATERRKIVKVGK